MAFVATKGGKKKVQARFEIRSRGASKASRAKELARFKRGLKALAKKHKGKVTS
jgi:hypothetical protein